MRVPGRVSTGDVVGAASGGRASIMQSMWYDGLPTESDSGSCVSRKACRAWIAESDDLCVTCMPDASVVSIERVPRQPFSSRKLTYLGGGGGVGVRRGRRRVADRLGVPLCDVTYADLKAKYGRRKKVD